MWDFDTSLVPQNLGIQYLAITTMTLGFVAYRLVSSFTTLRILYLEVLSRGVDRNPGESMDQAHARITGLILEQFNRATEGGHEVSIPRIVWLDEDEFNGVNKTGNRPDGHF
jgi:hypothetical protein